MKSHQNPSSIAPPTEVSYASVASPQASAPKKEKRGSLWEELFFGLLYALWGYAAGSLLLPFGARPFGIALLCGSDRRVPYLYAGLCLASWQTSERWLLLTVYTALLAIRILAKIILDSPKQKEAAAGKKGTLAATRQDAPLFSESLSLRMAASCVGAFALGLFRLVGGGFLYYDLYGTLIGIVAAPVAVLLLGGFFTREEVSTYRRMSGFLSLAFILLLAARDWRLYGVSPSVFGCMLLTLYVTRKGGIVAGMLTGTVCGLAISPDLAPLFAFAALCAGLLFPLSRALAVGAALSVGLAWGIYVRGIGVLDGILAGLLASALLFPILDQTLFSVSRKSASTAQSDERTDTAEEAVLCVPSYDAVDRARLTDTNRTVKNLCECFSALSEILFGLSRRMKSPSHADLRQICDRAFERSCASCPDRAFCWKEQYHVTSDQIGSLCMTLRQRGRLEISDADAALSERCHRLPDIFEDINHHERLHREQLLEGDRTELFAADYQALSDLLAASMVRQEGDYLAVDTLTQALCCAFNENRLPIQRALVFGGERKRVRVCAERSVLLSESTAIAQIIREVCHFPVGAPVLLEEADTVMEYTEAERFSVSCAQRVLCAEGEEEYCGDTVGMFRSEDGRFYSLISDGMGSGREAAMTSGICGVFLKKMLTSGSSCATAIDMLNHFLRNRGSGSLRECSATIDLMELDLLRGRAAFHKCGAAPTYIFREGGLLKLRSHTVPIGIIRQPDTRRLGFEVSAGDVIVMVSDGVTQGKEECPWLFDLLRAQGDSPNPDRLAELIVKYAKGEGSTDDLSVLIVKIEQA